MKALRPGGDQLEFARQLSSDELDQLFLEIVESYHASTRDTKNLEWTWLELEIGLMNCCPEIARKKELLGKSLVQVTDVLGQPESDLIWAPMMSRPSARFWAAEVDKELGPDDSGAINPVHYVRFKETVVWMYRDRVLGSFPRTATTDEVFKLGLYTAEDFEAGLRRAKAK